MKSFAADERALALFRIGLALVVILDVLDRIDNLDIYGPTGPTTPTTLGWAPSLHLLGHSEEFTAMHFGLTAVAAMALLVGFHTRKAAALCIVLVLSTQLRLPLVSFGGDPLMVVLLIFAVLVPTGAHWSMDGGYRRLPNRFASPATAALVFQPVALHLGSVLFKVQDAGWREGRVLGPLLTDHLHATLWGEWLAATVPEILPTMSMLALAIEAIAPLLLLFPHRATRSVGIVAIIALQVSMALFMDAGLFQLLAVVSVLPLLPSRTENPVVADSSRLRRWLGAAMLTMITCSNVLHPIVEFRWGAVPYALGLDQHWSMFATTTNLPRGWFYVVAQRPDGTLVNMWDLGPATGQRPMTPFPSYAGFRVRRLWEGQLYVTAAPLKDDILRWQCRRATAALGPVVAVAAWFADISQTPTPNYVTLYEGPCP
jgi:hypothetical protein